MDDPELIQEAYALFEAADLGFWLDEDDPDQPHVYALNMNDTWAWACADCERVPPEEAPEVARLFETYGHHGLRYWVSKRNGGMRSEFHDVNRGIEFVEQEERIAAEFPDSSARAYHRASYTLGASLQEGGQ